MAGPLLALGLLACPLLAWAALRRLGTDRAGAAARRRAAANRFLLLACAGYLPLLALLSTETIPWPAYFLPLGSMTVVDLLARDRKGARTAVLALGAAFFLLGIGYVSAAGGREWTGNPWQPRFRLGGLAMDGASTLTRWLLSDGGYARCHGDAMEVPPGWLDEASFLREDPASAALLGPPGGTTAPQPEFQWHSPLSGLWAVREVPVRYWYPGGPLDRGVHAIEVRAIEVRRVGE